LHKGGFSRIRSGRFQEIPPEVFPGRKNLISDIPGFPAVTLLTVSGIAPRSQHVLTQRVHPIKVYALLLKVWLNQSKCLIKICALKTPKGACTDFLVDSDTGRKGVVADLRPVHRTGLGETAKDLGVEFHVKNLIVSFRQFRDNEA
jgi:hypothetical protein